MKYYLTINFKAFDVADQLLQQNNIFY